MSYTNVHINDDMNLRKTARLQEAELAFWRATADELQAKLENIGAAVKEYGYVDLYYGRDKITLCLKPDAEPAS